MVEVDVKFMTLDPAGDTGRREGPRPGGRLSGPPLRWERVCVGEWVSTCAERKVRAGPRAARTTRIRAGLQAARPLPGLGSGRGPCSLPHLLCTTLGGAGFSLTRPTRLERQLLLVPFSESEELSGVSRPGYSLHCSPLCELSFCTLLL